MKKVIIGIHGLGNKPPHHMEEKWWKEAMMEGLKRIGTTPWLPIVDLVYWADLLYMKPLNPEEKNAASPGFVEEPYLSGPKELPVREDNSFRKKVLDFVEHQLDSFILNADFTMNYATIADMIVHRYFVDLEAYYADRFTDARGHTVKVRAKIRERLSKKLEKYQGCEIMLIGHSMGSIVAYDVLTLEAPRTAVDWFVTIGSPLGFPVVQGKIASERIMAGVPVSRLKTPPGVLKKWYNFADLRDRVAIVWQLAKNYAANAHGVAPEDREVCNDYTNGKEENPHKSYGYLRTEEFARRLAEFIGPVPVYRKAMAYVLHRFS